MAVINGVHVNGDINGDNPHGEPTLISPYLTKAVDVLIGPNGVSYTILQAMVDQYSGLQARINHKKPGAPIELPEVDEEIGHTLVHFIYTKEYNTLGLGGLSENLRAAPEFKRSVLAYCAARLCNIEQLEEVTKAKMNHFSKQISVFDMHDIVYDVSPKLPQNDIWFSEQLYHWVKVLLQENDQLVTNERLLDLVGTTALFDKAVLKSVAEMYSEKAAALKYLSCKEDETESSSAPPVTNGDHVHDVIDKLADLNVLSEESAEPIAPEAGTAETTSDDTINGVNTDNNGDIDTEAKSPQSLNDDWSAKPTDVGSTYTESVVVPDDEPESVVDSLAPVGKEGELANADNAGKATDTDVETARARANKKNKKKKNKKGVTEPPAAA